MGQKMADLNRKPWNIRVCKALDMIRRTICPRFTLQPFIISKSTFYKWFQDEGYKNQLSTFAYWDLEHVIYSYVYIYAWQLLS